MHFIIIQNQINHKLENIFHDKELGLIVTRYNARAKNIIGRYNKDHIVITVPVGFNMKNIPEIIDDMRPQLRNFIIEKEKNHRLVEDGMIIKTASLPIRIEVSDTIQSFYYSMRRDEAVILVSPTIDIESYESQMQLLHMINYIAYREAQRILILRTKELAKRHSLSVSQVKISKSRTRWGSCSHKKNINLSYYLMLLPQKLIDYVILHELAHTIELNHSEAFWDLLDTLCGEDSRALSAIARSFTSEDLELVRSY